MPQVCIYYLFMDPHLIRSIYQSLFDFIIHSQKISSRRRQLAIPVCKQLLAICRQLYELQCQHNYINQRTEKDTDKEHSCMHLTAIYMKPMLCWGLQCILYDSTYCGTTDQICAPHFIIIFIIIISSSDRKPKRTLPFPRPGFILICLLSVRSVMRLTKDSKCLRLNVLHNVTLLYIMSHL